jgi:hypothetical protein
MCTRNNSAVRNTTAERKREEARVAHPGFFV